jgi:hypothetical protein
MDHISENKSLVESIGVLIDSYNLEAQPVNFSQIFIHFYGRGWPLN